MPLAPPGLSLLDILDVACPACGSKPSYPCLEARTPVDPETRMEIPSASPAYYARRTHLKRRELAQRTA